MALVREPLVAHLRGDLVLHRRLLQQPRLPRRPGQRLLDVDVLAALHAGQRHGGVHEVGDADGAGVDVLAFLVQHDAEVFVLGDVVLLEVVPARASSTSHSATMFSVRAASFRIAPPWPPQPMAATFSLS